MNTAPVGTVPCLVACLVAFVGGLFIGFSIERGVIERGVEDASQPYIWRDAIMGCDYIVVANQLYPRMQADGSQVCRNRPE